MENAYERVKYVPIDESELDKCLLLSCTDTYVAAIVRLFTDQLSDIGFHNPAHESAIAAEFHAETVTQVLIPFLKEAERRLLSHGFIAWTPVYDRRSERVLPTLVTTESHLLSVAVEEGMYLGLVAQRRSDLAKFFGSPTALTIDRTVEFIVMDQPTGNGKLTSMMAAIARLSYINHSLEAYDVVGNATACAPPLALGNGGGRVVHRDEALLGTFTGDPSGDEEAQETQIRRQTQLLHAQTKDLMMDDARNVTTLAYEDPGGLPIAPMPSGAAALDHAVILGTGMVPQLLPTGTRIPDMVARRIQFETEVSSLMGAPRSLVVSEAKVVGDISAHEEIFARRSAILNARMLNMADAVFKRIWARADVVLGARCAVHEIRAAYDASLAKYAALGVDGGGGAEEGGDFSEYSAKDKELEASVDAAKTGMKRKREFGDGVRARFECIRALRVVTEFQKAAPVFEWDFVRNCFAKSLGIPLDVVSKKDPFRQNDPGVLLEQKNEVAVNIAEQKNETELEKAKMLKDKAAAGGGGFGK